MERKHGSLQSRNVTGGQSSVANIKRPRGITVCVPRLSLRALCTNAGNMTRDETRRDETRVCLLFGAYFVLQTPKTWKVLHFFSTSIHVYMSSFITIDLNM